MHRNVPLFAVESSKKLKYLKLKKEMKNCKRSCHIVLNKVGYHIRKYQFYVSLYGILSLKLK